MSSIRTLDGYTAAEAGKVLGVNPRTVRTWGAMGLLSGYRASHGKITIFDGSSVRALAEKRRARRDAKSERFTPEEAQEIYDQGFRAGIAYSKVARQDT